MESSIMKQVGSAARVRQWGSAKYGGNNMDLVSKLQTFKWYQVFKWYQAFSFEKWTGIAYVDVHFSKENNVHPLY